MEWVGRLAADEPSIVVKNHGYFGYFGFLQWFFWVGKTRSLGFLVFLGFAMLFLLWTNFWYLGINNQKHGTTIICIIIQ